MTTNNPGTITVPTATKQQAVKKSRNILNRYANFLSKELEKPVSSGQDCSFLPKNLQFSKKSHTFAVLTDNGCIHFAGQAVNLLNTFGLFLCPKSTYTGGRIYVDKIKALGVETIICKQRIWRPLFCRLNKKICLQMKTLTTKAISDGSHRAQPSLSLINRYANFLSKELEKPVSSGQDCSFLPKNLHFSKKTHTFAVLNYIMVRPFHGASVMLINKMGNFYAHNKNIRLYIQQFFALRSGTLCSLATGYYSRFSVYNAKLHKVMKTLTTKAISDGSHRAQPSLSLINRYANFLSKELEEEVSCQRAILLTIAPVLFCCAIFAGVGLKIFLFIIFMTCFVVVAYHAGMFPEWQKGGEQ